jgi:hypothetical protein
LISNCARVSTKPNSCYNASAARLRGAYSSRLWLLPSARPKVRWAQYTNRRAIFSIAGTASCALVLNRSARPLHRSAPREGRESAESCPLGDVTVVPVSRLPLRHHSNGNVSISRRLNHLTQLDRFQTSPAVLLSCRGTTPSPLDLCQPNTATKEFRPHGRVANRSARVLG